MGQNPTEDDLLQLLIDVDLDGNGSIDFPEFIEMMRKQNKRDDREELKTAFRIFDKNGDGFIDLTELHRALMMPGSMVSKEEVAEFMEEADMVSDDQRSITE